MAEPRVLVIEDEADAAEIIHDLLRYYELSADHVATGEDGYAALLSGGYDVVIADLFLPGMDGLELIRQVRQQPHLAGIPAIAITAYNSTTLKKQAYEAGYNRYYAKPLDPEQLVQALVDLLR